MIIWPFTMVGGVFVAMTFYRYLTEERGKKELRQTFAKYVSPAIVEELLSDPKNIELGGRKTNLTVFFSDVRGFTTISEKLDPRALSDLLNSYLTPMTELVFKNRGTLDKYMGDAVMAFFGAPIPYQDHAKYACRCALQSVKKLFELQEEYEKRGLPIIDIGIGLNTGEVSVGNMGSQTVRSYTVMGDAVNLASRLEGINKTYGTRIIISEFTYNQVKDDFICREVDWVRVKGKALPVKIYELIAEGKIQQQPSATQELLKWFQDGYAKYHEKSWSLALDCFTTALNLKPDDEVSKVYLSRCQEYLVEPPPDNWDGVFVMKTK
jgi:adenylate cyclase